MNTTCELDALTPARYIRKTNKLVGLYLKILWFNITVINVITKCSANSRCFCINKFIVRIY